MKASYIEVDAEDYIVFEGHLCVVNRVIYCINGKRLAKPSICSATICNRYGEPTGKEATPKTAWEFTVRDQREEPTIQQEVAKWNDKNLSFKTRVK